jgi:chromosomal replication initiation ATPase DnaA
MYHRVAEGRPSGWRAVERRLARRDRRALRVLMSVAKAQGVPVETLFAHSRCRSDVALARQLAMYLMHVALGRSIISVAKLFKRHMSTVIHSCHVIEDRRDAETFDRMVSDLEASAITTRPNRNTGEERRHVDT